MDYSSRFVATLIAALYYLGAAPAMAQTTEPVALPTIEKTAPLPTTSAAQVQVQVQSLGQVEPFRVGALSGIPFKMPMQQWQGTRTGIAAQLMSDLPEIGASPLLNRLSASVLISPSNPPTDGEGDMALASLRLASVYRLGQLQAVINLAERSPGGLSDPENAAIATRAFLALGQESNACETAIRLQNGRGAIFWLKVRAFCLAREGRTAAAELTADLVLETDPEDVDFLLALNRMVHKDKTVIKPVNALELAMARFSKAPIDLSEAPFSLKSAMVEAEGEVGLDAARMMAAAGLLNADTLAQIYLGWPGLPASEPVPAVQDETQITQPAPAPEDTQSPEESDAALLAVALAQTGAPRAALLYQSALRASTPAGLAKAAYGGLKQEKELGAFLAAARLYAPLLQDISTQNLPLGQAMGRLFVYAALAAERPELATTFINAAPARLQRFMTLSQKSITLTGLNFHTENLPQVKDANLAYTDLLTLWALGAPLNDQHRRFLFNQTIDNEEFSHCRAGAMAAITDGARHKARAASFLRAALMLADTGFDRVAPQCGANVIQALKTMGYEGLARQAALEMMLGPRLQRVANLHE
ncbi:MAG: hypothetical protein COA85_02210 [Robiginitomaculum sp.]|nr:MAG: hypothetical protein COA85_02210 [Robiginitomaculum sp.]